MSISSYTIGPAPPQQQGYASFGTKPSPTLWTNAKYSDDPQRRSKYETGGGYERWRSYELRPEQLVGRKEDVYVPHHRLLAVVACYPPDMPLAEILEHLGDRDVHHTTGVEWCNFGDSPNLQHEDVTGVDDDGQPKPGLEVRDHGSHSAITQAQIRAWAEDERRGIGRDATSPTSTDESACAGCGDPMDTVCTSEDFDGERCLECAKRASDGAPINVGGTK